MGSGGVAIAALPTVICLKVPFSDGLGGIWIGMPVSLKREGFYRILDNKIQAELFSYFQKDGAHKKVRSISLSDEDLKKCLNHI